MSAVRNWLEAIGLAQYADAFEANDIDTDLLTQIDDQVLKDIGVSSAGHRLRLRNAIAKLAPTSPSSSTTRGAMAISPTGSATIRAPRRRFTTASHCGCSGRLTRIGAIAGAVLHCGTSTAALSQRRRWRQQRGGRSRQNRNAR